MSGQVPKHAAPSRDDDIQMKTPENSVKTQPPNNSTLPKSAEVHRLRAMPAYPQREREGEGEQRAELP
jgi:hypothetical protein